MKRTDIHRPSVIVPEDYEFVAFERVKIEGIGDCHYILAERKRIRAHMDRTGGNYSSHEHGGNCMVCGNVMATYTILFYHAKTNTYVRVGHDCADKMEMSYGDFNAFTRGVNNALERKAGKAKAKKILEDAGLSRAWDLYTAEWNKEMKYEEDTVRDIVGKLVKYGSVSDKALGFAGRLLKTIDERAVVEAKRKAEAALAEPVPVTPNRILLTGTVLYLRVEESNFGYGWRREGNTVTKMLFKDDRGFKLWGTRPTIRLADIVGPGVNEWHENYHCAEKGDRIKFFATVTPSDKDPKFGFFSRPTKGELLETGTAVVETEEEKTLVGTL